MQSGEANEALARYRDARRAPYPVDYRTPAERDRDRILYCSAFRRLGSVTQVLSTGEIFLLHNRLTHTLKVAQIGRRLAQSVQGFSTPEQILAAGGINPDTVEAAALAHDLGHPPFGHIAEDELRILSRGRQLADSFEGNAQTFRIVAKLAFRSLETNAPALNLTRATLCAILKYPWVATEHPDRNSVDKWGSYFSERGDFSFAVEGREPKVKCVEAALMDWADDVAYAVHDVQDFYTAGLIPLDQLRSVPHEGQRFVASAAGWLAGKGWDGQKCESAFERIQALLPREPYGGTRADRAAMHSLASTLITRYVAGVQLLDDGSVHEPENLRYELEMLKQLTWYYVINRAPLATLQRGQRGLIHRLFHRLLEWAGEAAANTREEPRLPVPFRELLTATRSDPAALAAYGRDDEKLRVRAVVDYIASLIEEQAIRLDARLDGRAENESALEVWLR